MERSISFQEACRTYVHRYTGEHVPDWACRPAPNGKFYAPQFRDDRDWYDHTRFYGEEGHCGRKSDCFTTEQTWPLGHWLDECFRRRPQNNWPVPISRDA